jgi:uncharacterized phage protein gp47/JayE
MYEKMTFEVILQRMLGQVPNTVDKREGSIIYNALAPAAVELQNMYIEFDWILNQSFADTAQRDYLIRRCAERGIIPEPATKAILQGNFNVDIPIGSRFSLDNLNYKAIGKIADGVFKMECETVGKIGNQTLGTLIPIDYIEGLTSAKLTAVLIPGEDEEDTEVLRQRYLNSFKTNSYGGNKQDYIQKTNAIPGVGSTKVTPIWKGGGTVKLTILDSGFNKASSALIDTVQKAIDPSNSPGQGLGIAPIGHIVTVDTATEVIVNITTTVTLDTGYTWGMVEPDVLAAMKAYMLEIRTDWANQNQSYVRIAQIETRMLAIKGIIDISGTKINGLAQNLTLNNYEIPVLGAVIAS